MAIDWTLSLYDADGDEQTPDLAFIGPWSFSLSERGGFDTFTLTLKCELDDDLITVPEVNWRIDIEFNGEMAYRGWVETVRPSIVRGAPVTQLSGAGLMARIQEFAVNSVFIVPAPTPSSGVDLFQVYTWLADRYLDGAGRLGTYTRDILSPTGTTVNYLEMFGSNVRRELDRLAEIAGDSLIWGFDAPSGDNRLYAKQRVNTRTQTDYLFTLGTDPIVELEITEDLSDVVNKVRLIGGKAAAPNLLYNSSYELPRQFTGSNPVTVLFDDPIYQDGWDGTVKGLTDWSIDWVSDGLTSGNEPYHGTYFVRVTPEGATDETDGDDKYQHFFAIHPGNDHWISLKKETEYVIRFALRSSAELKFRIDLQVKKSNDKIELIKGTQQTRSGAGFGVVEETLTTEEEDVAARPILYLLSDVTVDIDAADMFMVGLNRLDYIPGEVVELTFRADDTTALPGLSTDAQASIGLYGIRERDVQTEEVTDPETVAAWVTGYLNSAAVPRKMGKVALEPCPVHVRFVNSAGTAMGQVEIAGARVTIPPIAPKRLTYSSTEYGDVRLEMELGERQPDIAIGSPAVYIPAGGSPVGGLLGSPVESNYKAQSFNSFNGGHVGPSDTLRLTYGPNEPGVYATAWDATEAGGRADGSVHAVTLQYSDGTPFEPASGSLVTVHNERGFLLDGVDYTITGDTLTLQPGSYLIDWGDGSERLIIDVTPPYTDSLL